MDLDTGVFVCKVVIGVALIVKIVLGLIQDRRDKKTINVASRGRGHVDKDGYVHLDSIDSFDIVK